jgi:hypothetical protein
MMISFLSPYPPKCGGKDTYLGASMARKIDKDLQTYFQRALKKHTPAPIDAGVSFRGGVT